MEDTFRKVQFIPFMIHIYLWLLFISLHDEYTYTNLSGLMRRKVVNKVCICQSMSHYITI